jgi:hypothetical protein
MKKNRSILVGLVAGISALAFSSCAYDPYYSASYGGGYGDGYGYGSSGFSTSVFVRTGSSRWAYDPYAGAYYDYTRRAYYDPYLYGYYPVGYRPRYVYGSPHPHGWRKGSGYCPPPSKIRSYNLKNYHDRGERYRSLGRSWSDNVRVNASGRDQRSGYGDRDRRSGYGDRDGDRSRNDWMQRSSRDGRSNPAFGNRSGGNRSGESDGSGFNRQRGGGTQPDFRSRDRSRELDARSDRSGSFGGSPSPAAFSNPSRDGGGRDWSNRGGRSPQQSDRGDVRSREPQATPQVEREAPRFQGRGRTGGGDRGGSGRGGNNRLRGLGEG